MITPTSPYDGYSRALPRVVLALVLAFDTAVAVAMQWRAEVTEIAHPLAPAWLVYPAGRPAVLLAIAGVVAASLARFARRPGRIAPGLVALVCVGWLVECDGALREGQQRFFFAGGACMLGWVASLAYARRLGLDDEAAEVRAGYGAPAVLAATYVNAFLSKMSTSGLQWADADGLRSVVLTQHPIDRPAWVNAYADLVATRPSFAMLLTCLTLVAQGSAFFYAWSPRTRAVSGTLLLAFHLNTAILTPFFFPQNMVLLLALSYPWARWWAVWRGVAPDPRRTEQPPPDVRHRHVVRQRAIAIAALLVLLAWLPTPLGTYTRLQHHHHESSR